MDIVWKGIRVKPQEYLVRVRNTQPLVHHITNWVTIGDCAMVTRVFGALPVMAHDEQESGDMTHISSSLILNIGTPSHTIIRSMIASGRVANMNGIPVVFDAVGVGATSLRNVAAADILEELSVAVIKGNASEIARIGGVEVITRGVEATEVNADLVEIARMVAERYTATVAITGAEDVVTDAKRVFIVRNGHTFMGEVVGTGCMAASVIGAFAAVAEGDFTESTAAALACFGVAGELAAQHAGGPASFKVALFDAIYHLSGEQVERMARIDAR